MLSERDDEHFIDVRYTLADEIIFKMNVLPGGLQLKKYEDISFNRRNKLNFYMSSQCDTSKDKVTQYETFKAYVNYYKVLEVKKKLRC